ncbi:aldo/keto reductase [Glycomyces endophyticus]|uniref:Aldo/keto reductase n=2 Tax=Glycomyces endophyticus TaxID=480996 RepID=A0ABN2FVL1_9ACTN
MRRLCQAGATARRRRARADGPAAAPAAGRLGRTAARVGIVLVRPDRVGATCERGRFMEYTRVGASGLKVSRIALGCMSFGQMPGDSDAWALGPEESAPLFRRAVELGITFWDTANMYWAGSSEELVGKAIREYTRREDVVLATKVFFKMHDGPGGSGLSRRAILEQIDASLARLGTDYVDLYQIHRFDPETPVEETMEALHDVVRAGKVRYIGASSMWAWQFAKMQHAADANGWTRFISMQDQYNLMQREEEREMFGLLDDQGVGSLPWSPLAKGRLARPWGERTARSERDPMAARYDVDRDRPIVEAVARIAQERGVPMAQIALAWVLGKSAVTAPIVGPTGSHHLADAAAAVDLRLTDDEVAALEEHYTPRLPTAFS